MYSKKVMQHFMKPKHVGEIKNPDGVATVGNVLCGDQMVVFIKVKDNKIIDAKFKTFGCGAAIASSDVLCELAKGKTIDQALKITNKDIDKYLGGLPKIKMHCSVLGMEGLHRSIEDYKKKHKT